MSLEDMCQDKDITGAALREIINYGKAHRLEKFEIPGRKLLSFGFKKNLIIEKFGHC